MKFLKVKRILLMLGVVLASTSIYSQVGSSCSTPRNFCTQQTFTISNPGDEVFLVGYSNSNLQTYFAIDISTPNSATNFEFTWVGLSGNTVGDNCGMFSAGELLTSGISNGLVQLNSKRGIYQYGLKIKLLSSSSASFTVNEKLLQGQKGVSCVFVGPPPCVECLPDFSPVPGKYLVSGWVKLDNYNGLTQSYAAPNGPRIKVDYLNGGSVVSSQTLQPVGAIIDGWQKIDGLIDVPSNATDIKVNLQASSSVQSFFDDIRFHPFDASMLSYVYDTRTLRLVAELDERNYATFYEYDEEGKLTRIKKETEKGIMTIQENRESIIKQ